MSGLYGGHYKPDELVTGPEMVQERKLCAQSVVGVLISNLREEAKTTIGYMKKAENRVIVFRNDKYAKTLDSSLTPQMNGGSSDFPEDIPDPSESAKLGENNRIAKQTCENSINNDNQPTASFVSAVSISSTTGAKPQSANQARIPSIEMSVLVDRAKTCVPDDFTYKGAVLLRFSSANFSRVLVESFPPSFFSVHRRFSA